MQCLQLDLIFVYSLLPIEMKAPIKYDLVTLNNLRLIVLNALKGRLYTVNK